MNLTGMTRHIGGVLLALALSAGPALAHKVRVFAAAEGDAITGYAYLSGGARAKGARVSIQGPDGAVWGETVTDDNGEFRFIANSRIDHRIVIDAGEGHGAEFTVKAEELPETLTPISAPAITAAAPPASVGAARNGAEPAPAAVSPDALQAMITEAVARQIRPLREQLDAYEDRVRWHDVLGGIGYIFGVAGTAFYLLGRRRRPEAPQ